MRFKLAFDIFLFLIAAFVFLRTITSLWLPFGYDHGMMAAAGHAYVEGGLPYRDAWDMKGPLAFFGFALAEIIFGRTMWGIRIIDVTIIVLAAATLGKFIAKHSTPRYGIAGALAFLLCISANGWFFTAQPEGWVAAASTFAIVPILQANRNADWRRAALSGFMVALCGLIKPLYFLFGLVPLTSLVLDKQSTFAQRVRFLGVLALSAALPVSLVLAFFLAKGGLADLVEVHILYTARSYADFAYSPMSIATTLWDQSVTNLLHINTGGVIPIVCLTPFIAVGLWSRRKAGVLFVGLVCWFCVALFCIVLQGKYYTYHWVPLYPPAVALAVLGIADWFGYTRWTTAKTIVGIGFASAFIFLAARTSAQETLWTARYLLRIIPNDQYYGYFHIGYNVRDVTQAVRYLRTHANKEDKLFIWGHEATINYLAELGSPSRFTFSLPLAKPGPFLKPYRCEVLEALRTNSPRFIIVGTPYESETDDKLEFIELFPEFQEILRSKYENSMSFGNIDLYERKAGPLRATNEHRSSLGC